MLVLAGCPARPAIPRLPQIVHVAHFEPNQCADAAKQACRADPDCLPGVKCVSALTTAADVVMRDGAHSTRVGDRVLWVFGDTISSDLELRSATAAWSDPAAPLRLLEETDDRGVPLQLYPFTRRELAFNRAHAEPPDCCGDQADCPPDNPYCHCAPDADCAERIALWPGDAVDLGDGHAAVYYEKFVIGTAYYDYRRVNTGIARVELGGSVAERVRGSDGEPLALFTEPEPRFLYAVRDGEWVYVYGSAKHEDDCATDVYLARVPRDAMARRQAYSFWKGESWTEHLAAANPVLRGIPGGLGSVAWNETLGSYVSAHADLCTKGRVYMRAAPRPQGPWSDAIEVDLSPLGASPAAYYALLHPELARGSELVLSYFDFVSDEAGQIRLVRLRLE